MINANSAAGSSQIESSIIKHCAFELTPLLTFMFNCCLNSGCFPDEWKIAHITPIFKGKGKQTDITNYRPISVLSPIAKLFESLLAIRISDYMESTNPITNTPILHDSQFGFRQKNRVN